MEVSCAAADAELVADLLFSAGAGAVAEEADADRGVTLLVADLDPASVGGFEQVPGPPRKLRVVEVDPGWATAWRDHARARRAGPFVVRPPWVEPPPGPRDGTVDLVVDPGEAFGSGSHPTTRLCLAALAEEVRTGDTVLDVGCGSGILAVGALLLGAGSALGIDTDPGSPPVATAVARANGVADRFEASGRPLADVVARGPWDVVVANLPIGAIEDVGAQLEAGTRRILVASGLLADRVPRARRSVPGLELRARAEEDGWVALTFVAP